MMQEKKKILHDKPLEKGPFLELSEQCVYENRWIRVTEHRVIRPDGADGLFGITTISDGVTVLPFTDDGKVILSKEFKFAVNSWSIEAFSGAIEDDESPAEAARRELREELDMDALELTYVTFIKSLPTLVSGTNHVFFASGLFSSPLMPDPGEEITSFECDLSQAFEMVATGKINHAASSLAVAMAYCARASRS